MHRGALLGLVSLLVAGSASAGTHARRSHGRRAHASSASYFLAGDPHVPLAVVRGRRIDDHGLSDRRCGARRRWKTLGSRWTALDAWGKPLGTFAATGKDDYDATGCAELEMSPTLANDLSHVFVSIDSAWRPSASAEWTAPAAKRAALEPLAKRFIDDAGVPKDYVWPQCRSVSERTRFFHVPGRGDWAVATSNAGWLVARDEASGWSVRDHDRVKPRPAYPASCFRPVAIFDMNGDGVPELVMRFSGGDGWADFVMVLGSDDHWRIVATSKGGSTA